VIYQLFKEALKQKWRMIWRIAENITLF